MSANENSVTLDVYDLQVTGDPSPRAGTATEVTVSFRFNEPFYTNVFFANAWPFSVKLYAERIGAGAVDIPVQSFTCNQASPDYQLPIPVTLNQEGVYLISALVELDNNLGTVMGWSDTDVRISVWTAP